MKLFGFSPDLRRLRVCFRLPPAPPFIAIAWRVRDRILRLIPSLSDKGTFITVFNPDTTRGRPSLLSLTLPVPETGSYSQAPCQVNDTPVFVGLQFTRARRTNILNRSSSPVSEISAVPMMSISSLSHCDVSVIRHQP